MKYYLVEEEANYCGFDEEYLIKSDKPFDDVDMLDEFSEPDLGV